MPTFSLRLILPAAEKPGNVSLSAPKRRQRKSKIQLHQHLHYYDIFSPRDRLEQLNPLERICYSFDPLQPVSVAEQDLKKNPTIRHINSNLIKFKYPHLDPLVVVLLGRVQQSCAVYFWTCGSGVRLALVGELLGLVKLREKYYAKFNRFPTNMFSIPGST